MLEDFFIGLIWKSLGVGVFFLVGLSITYGVIAYIKSLFEKPETNYNSQNDERGYSNYNYRGGSRNNYSGYNYYERNYNNGYRNNYYNNQNGYNKSQYMNNNQSNNPVYNQSNNSEGLDTTYGNENNKPYTKKNPNQYNKKKKYEEFDYPSSSEVPAPNIFTEEDEKELRSQIPDDNDDVVEGDFSNIHQSIKNNEEWLEQLAQFNALSGN